MWPLRSVPISAILYRELPAMFDHFTQAFLDIRCWPGGISVVQIRCLEKGNLFFASDISSAKGMASRLLAGFLCEQGFINVTCYFFS